MQYPRKARLSSTPSVPYGFTLIELMSVLAASVFVLTLVSPSISTFSQRNQQTSAANTLLSTLEAARYEAIQRNTRISVCQSTDGQACGTSGWEKGWILFSDAGAPGQVDPGDSVLFKSQALPENLQLSSQDFQTYISYRSDGSSSASGSFEFCNRGSNDPVKMVCVSNMGRASVSGTTCFSQRNRCS